MWVHLHFLTLYKHRHFDSVTSPRKRNDTVLNTNNKKTYDCILVELKKELVLFDNACWEKDTIYQDDLLTDHS